MAPGKREEIIELIKTLGIKVSWLSKEIGLKEYTLEYLLYNSPKFDEDLYSRLIEIIENYQFELDFKDKTTDDTPDLFDDNAITGRIGERIRIFAKRKFGTSRKLAEMMNMSPQQLQQYISGKREPGTKILIKLLKLGCDLNWLLGSPELLENMIDYNPETDFRKYQKAFSEIQEIFRKYSLTK